MPWEPTEISIQRSYIHHGTWVPIVPDSDIASMLDAGPINLVKKHTAKIQCGGRTKWSRQPPPGLGEPSVAVWWLYEWEE